MEELSQALIRTVDSAAEELKQLNPEAARKRPAPGKWSKQEILGHLIDSAANNHQRFVRAQYTDPLILPKYAQDDWVRIQDYQNLDWHEMLEFWRLYNRHLASIIAKLPKDKLEVLCKIGDYEPATLKWICDDYLVHMKHHLAEMLGASNASI